MTPHKTLVWMDHQEAKIFRLEGGEFRESDVHAPKEHVHRHAKAPGGSSEHPEDQRRYFVEVAKAIDDAAPVVLLGPSTAKLQFLRWLSRERASIEARIVAIETADHPSSAQLMAHAKRSFGMPVRLGQ